jgi:hypothetical protein
MIKIFLLACTLFLSLNLKAAELIKYSEIFSVWKAEIATSLWDEEYKTIFIYGKPEINTLCSTVVREIEAKPNVSDYFYIESESRYRLYSPINKSKGEDYCMSGPHDTWFRADMVISPAEIAKIKNIFDFSDENLRISADYDVRFESSQSDLKSEFKELRYLDLLRITVDESKDKNEILSLVFISRGVSYMTITLRINRNFSKGDVIKVSAAQ